MPAHAARSVFYDRTTIGLHWAIACLVAAQWVGAELIDYLPGRPVHMFYWSSHITLGLLLTGLMAVQMWWRATRGARLPDSNEGGWKSVTHIMHWLLNALPVFVVLLGLGIVLARGWTLFGTIAIPMVPGGSRHLAGQIHGIHEWAAHVLVFLAAGHAGAALFHHYRLRDGVLARMVPRLARR